MSARVAVVGLGSIGGRHLENLQALGCEAVAVRRAPGKGELGSLDEVMAWGAEAIVIATPTSEHATALRWAVERGIHAYVEKPLANRSFGLAELLERAVRNGVVVATGHNLRFHPALEAVRAAVVDGRIGRLLNVRAEVGQYLPDWHPDEDYRGSYAARADLGGGALLTLSHELDYVRWIAGEVVECSGRTARLSELVIDADDVAEILTQHDSGALGFVHLDFLDRSYNRRSRWVGERATIVWEWGGPVRLLPDDLALWDDPSFDLNATYLAALADFLACAESGARPRADGRDGLRALEVCEAVGR